jgi:hypothetical protein
MSKEYLEALNKLQHDFGQLKGQELVSCYETIFNALKRLEAIDNANPSEALEEIKTLRGFNQVELNNDENVNKSLNTIQQALLKAQEQEAKFLDNLQRWFLLLGESGANTKYKVRDEMEAVIDELKEVLE